MDIAIGKTMKLLILRSTDPYLNLAIEEYLFLNTKEPVFMLWQNAASVIIGKNQNAYAEIDREYADAHGIRIARRITGGGAVYHDLGNVNYSYISPDESGQTIDFKSFSEPLLRALAALSIPATLSGRNDIEIDGKKISGNAQHRVGTRLLHHGTLLFDADTEVMGRVLRPNREKLQTRAIRSVGARVCNLRASYLPDWTKDQFLDYLAHFIEKEYAAERIEPPEKEEIRVLAQRNASSEWLFPERDLLSEYTQGIQKRYPFGTVEILLSMRNDRIEKIAISGDFFGCRSVRELEELLTDVRLCRVREQLSRCCASDFIFGMQNEELIALLAGNGLASESP